MTEHQHHGPNGRVITHNHNHGNASHYHGQDAPPAWKWYRLESAADRAKWLQHYAELDRLQATDPA